MKTKEIPLLKRSQKQAPEVPSVSLRHPLPDTNVKTRKPPKKKTGLRINWLLLFALICVSVPSLILAWILYSASLETSIPQEGKRFEGSFAFVLKKDDLKNIEKAIATINGVEDVVISRPVATVRIYIDVDDNLKEEAIKNITLEAYKKLDELYPINDYFTAHGDRLTEIVIDQYDLEIYTYNNLSFEDNFIYYRLVKNAMSETYSIQNVSEPVDPDLAERLRNKQPLNDSGTVGEEEGDDTIEEEIIGD